MARTTTEQPLIHRCAATAAIGIFLALCGCQSVPHGGQHFDVSLHTASAELKLPDSPCIVIEEFYRIEESPDGLHRWATLSSARIQCIQGNRFQADAPKTTDHFFFFFNDRQEYRWIIIKPGYAVTTYYAEGFTPNRWDIENGHSVDEAASGNQDPICYPATPHSYATHYPQNQQKAQLSIQLWTLNPEIALRQAKLPTTHLSDGTEQLDARNFDDQVKTITAAISQMDKRSISLDCRRILWQTVKAEHDAMDQAGFDQQIRAEYQHNIEHHLFYSTNADIDGHVEALRQLLNP